MMKKLLFILLLIISVSAFAQEETKTELSKNEISSVSAYPNPFKTKTNINFYSTANSYISLTVQDLLGNTLFSDKRLTVKGKNSIPFYRNKLTAGIYIYTLKTKDKVIAKRFVIK